MGHFSDCPSLLSDMYAADAAAPSQTWIRKINLKTNSLLKFIYSHKIKTAYEVSDSPITYSSVPMTTNILAYYNPTAVVPVNNGYVK